MSTSRFSIDGGPLFEMARARQQEMLDAATRNRVRPVACTRGDVDTGHVDYGAWLRIVAATKSAR
jgi:hypothetical protein